MTDAIDGTAQAQPAEDSIRSALTAALAEHETPTAGADTAAASTNGAAKAGATDAAADAVAADVVPVADTGAEGKTERKRGPDGKFIKADGSADDAVVANDAAGGADAAVGEATAKTEAQPVALELPANWSAADREKFKTLPPDGQRILKDMITRQEADYTKKTQAVAALKAEYEPVDQLFAPHRDAMRIKGLTPRALIEGWANVEKGLSEGRGVSIIKGLVDGYRIDVAALAPALGLSRAAPQQHQVEQTLDEQGNPIAQPQLPPQLVQELQALRERQDAIDRAETQRRDDETRRAQAAQSAELAKINSEIEKFKSADDGKGNLTHPHFAEVENDMVILANGYRARAQDVPPLQELYERAVRANPSTYEALRTAEQQAAERKRSDEARAKAAAAKKAASSVTGAPGSGQAAPAKSADRSLRETLEDAAADAA